jgi:hypothetical protein
MNIGKLHSNDSRYSVPAVHPRLAVINASLDQRVDLIDAARGAGAQVVDQADADAAVLAEKQRRQEAHDLAVAAQQDRLGVAAAELELAISGEREAAERKSALSGAIADFDVLAAEAMETDRRRNEAWADRRRAMQLMVEAVDQLERVQVQRRSAASNLNEAQTHFRDSNQPDPPDALAELQMHVSAVHAALDKAETQRQSEARDAERQLVAAMADVGDADAAMAGIWSRLAENVAAELMGRWGHGHPEAGMIADHRETLVGSGPSLESDRARAASVVATASAHRDDEARRLEELDGADAEAAWVVDALRAWLTVTLDDQPEAGGQSAPLALDNAFAGIDAAARSSLMDELIAASARTQLLYLTDQVDVLAWAISLPHDIGGLDHVATAGHVLALTD